MSILKDEEPPLFKTSDYTFTKRKIEEDENIKKSEIVKTSISMRITKYLATSRIEDVIEILNAICSFLLTLFFAVDTYNYETPIALQYLELIIIIYLFLDFLLFFYISENRLLYLFCFQSMVSYATLIPIFLVRIKGVSDPSTIAMLKFWRVFRLFSILRLDKFFSRRNMSLARVFFRLIYIFGTTIMIFAASMLQVENNYYQENYDIILQKNTTGQFLTENQKNLLNQGLYTFHIMLYYMVITITTVGYGDIYPKTWAGQMLVIAVILVILAFLPKQWQEFTKVRSLTSKYARKYYSTKGKKDAKHIMVLGDATNDAIKTFLTECYHSDHGITETNVIIMRNHPPNEELLQILKLPNFEQKAIYLEGNPMYPKDLKRCQAEKAKCCIVLSNQFCKNPQQEDQKNILTAFSVKKYVRQQCNKEMRVCLQISKPEHKDLYYSGLCSKIKIDQVLCVEELKLQLLAKSSICPGIITIIWSLITSSNYNLIERYEEDDNEINYQQNQQMQRDQQEQKGGIKSDNKIPHTRMNTSTSSFNASKKQNSAKYANPNGSQKQSQAGDASRQGKERWQQNYESGTKYELYRIPLKHAKYEGLKFKDICMILYQKISLMLIALEIRIADQIKVFVNPAEYVFDDADHYGYVIHYKNPDFDAINNIDLNRQSAENIFIFDYINKKEQVFNQKEQLEMNINLSRMLDEEHDKIKQINYENFFSTKKPIALNQARIKKKLDKSIEGHIIVCGIVKGIKNLILPLRSKALGQRRPIVILSNDNLGDEDMSGDTQIWGEINRFEEIYLIRGSALNPADLQKARVNKAKAIIILAKSYENSSGVGSQSILDADAIFMYKTIEANYGNNHMVIVTELTSMGTIAFLVQGNEEKHQKQGYFNSRPFAAGEIYVSSLLDSLMCQAYYCPKITEILEQLIMGCANTSERIMKIYRQLNLSQCSLNLIEIPKKCNSLVFSSIFEFCVKNYNMIPIAVYKRYIDDNFNGIIPNSNGNMDKEEKSNKKPYVWLHPPKMLELTIHDELFVLCDKNPNSNDSGSKARANNEVQGSKLLKNEEKKVQKENLSKLANLNSMLQDLLYSTKELATNIERSNEYISNDLSIKIKSDLESIET